MTPLQGNLKNKDDMNYVTCHPVYSKDNSLFEVIQMDFEARWEGGGREDQQSNIFYTFSC